MQLSQKGLSLLIKAHQEVIHSDDSVERSDSLSMRLALLNKIIEASIRASTTAMALEHQSFRRSPQTGWRGANKSTTFPEKPKATSGSMLSHPHRQHTLEEPKIRAEALPTSLTEHSVQGVRINQGQRCLNPEL
nr:hypothetical protein 39 [bacterium]